MPSLSYGFFNVGGSWANVPVCACWNFPSFGLPVKRFVGYIKIMITLRSISIKNRRVYVISLDQHMSMPTKITKNGMPPYACKKQTYPGIEFTVTLKCKRAFHYHFSVG